MKDSHVVIWVFIFVASAIVTPMLIMQARYNYKPSALTMWPLYPVYIGNLLAGSFAPTTVPRSSWVGASRIFCLDASGQTLAGYGLLVVGPPLFAIFYKSVTVFTGLMSVFVLPPKCHPTKTKWLAMIIITAGLGIQGFDAFETFDKQHVVGALAVVAGCVFYAGSAVATENLMVNAPEKLEPLHAAWVVGVEGCFVCALWAVLTIQSAETARGFWLLMVLMCLSNALHQAAWFHLVGALGASTTAVLKAFQSVCLFIAASFVFCSVDQTECLTYEKIFSFIVVSAGMLLYSLPVNGRNGPSDSTPILKGHSAAARPSTSSLSSSSSTMSATTAATSMATAA
eukprot:CAMPEP_0206438902 /NCGR_PEP_ID=MMETSP0324_2-20121206/11906_1 /ASSEMBLY_ACC=CAM_ASM_000836 /TAXON_ID=2866 /ORGANISM="Crypthecodinium cohnii, Strain Seligo" /LENGTH=341 /DNA_ID=CAMNT_0053906449 /DNA_START=14 /DNA_END=1039 /DNA_ORIENTATION=+